MSDLRVEPGPAARRGAPLSFRFEGRTITAYEGETVGAALHAADERVLMRSIKYHRPRGLFCNVGKCANCLVRVDGTPNVRACVTPAREGMVVETQNAFPSARRDLFAIVDKVYPKNFDYHARFIRPRFMQPIYNGVIRRMAGFGRIPDLRPVRRPTIQRRHVDVCVIGAGASGLSAAVAAAEGAASVLCVDEGDRAGGSLLLHHDIDGKDGATIADELVQRLQDAHGELLLRTTAIGIYGTDAHGDALPAPGLLVILTPERIIEVHAHALVVCTGHHETPPLFPGNDLPGILGARAALILLRRHGILPGRRIALAGKTGLAGVAEAALRRAGADIIDLAGGEIIEASGSTRVEHVLVRKPDGTTTRHDVDAVLACGDETPRVELLQQAGARLALRGHALAPAMDGTATSAPRVHAAGLLARDGTPRERMADGARAGEAAARRARQEEARS